MKVKKNLISVAIFLGLFSGCSEAMNKEKTEFEWFAVACAPLNYPMEVRFGEFIYKGTANTGLAIPSGGTLTQGWGRSFSAYVVGPKQKPLPDSLKVTFYSYAEKQFYSGTFDLPYEKMLQLFQQRQRDFPEEPYDSILLGVAPGGVVTVWLHGAITTEVFFGYAQKREIDPKIGFALPFTSVQQSDEYVEKALAEAVTPEQLAFIKKYGPPLGAWERFRKLYKWRPVYKDDKVPLKADMPGSFVNGERYRIPTQFTDEYANTPKPLLQETNFRALGPEGPVYTIKFDEMELIEVFEKLGSNGELVNLEFDPRIPRNHMKIRAYNDTESIEFKKVYIKE